MLIAVGESEEKEVDYMISDRWNVREPSSDVMSLRHLPSHA